MKRFGSFLEGAVNVFFSILMFCILISTVVIDKSIDNPYPNTAVFANGAYYLFALFLLFGAFRMLYDRPAATRPEDLKEKGRMSPRAYYCALAAIALATALLQFFISKWMPLSLDYFQSDFKLIMEAGWKVAHGGSLESYGYFQISPNNVNMAIVMSWVYRVLPNLRAGVWLGALSTNASVVLTSLCVYKVTRREGLALSLAVGGEVLLALNWRAFLMYTDNYGMIFIALTLWLYTSDLKPFPKALLIILCTAFGSFIKITNFVVFMAFAIHELIRWLRSDDRRSCLKRAALIAVCFVVIFGGMLASQGPIRRHLGFVPGKYPKGWQYLFMVGQNTERLGLVGGDNGHVRDVFIKEYKDQKKVQQACLQKAFEYIRKRGILGNIIFYMKKLTAAYNDGCFHNVQKEKMYKMEKNLLYNIYFPPGKYYQAGVAVFQTLWDSVLAGMILYALYEFLLLRRRRRENRLQPGCLKTDDPASGSREDDREQGLIRFLKITVLGITLYLMCLEGRSKYLYMFLPIFLAAFGLMFNRLGTAASEALLAVRNARRDGK